MNHKSYVKLFGNTITNYIKVSSELSPAEKNAITNTNLNLSARGNKDIFLADFQTINGDKGNFSGSNFIGNYENISYFSVYKKDIQEDHLYKVCDTSKDFPIAEDFLCGNGHDYEYYIYAVCIENNKKVIKAPIKVQKHIDFDACALIGTKPLSEKNQYVIDYNNIWTFELNLSPDQYQINSGKNIVDTLNQFPVEISTKKHYLTGGNSYLLGDVQCVSNGETYSDNVHIMEKFEQFCDNGQLKILKDVRGRLIPCTVSNLKYQYMSDLNYAINVSASITQLQNIKNIEIVGDYESTLLHLYPALKSKDDYILQSSEPYTLITPMESR